MDTKTPSLVVADDLVVSLEYKLTVDDEVVDAQTQSACVATKSWD